MTDLYAPGALVADRYQIAAALGRGSMGTTYAAVDRQTDQQVAIEVVSLRQVSDSLLGCGGARAIAPFFSCFQSCSLYHRQVAMDTAAEPATVVVAQRVKPERETDCEAWIHNWIHNITQASSRYPGH